MLTNVKDHLFHLDLTIYAAYQFKKALFCKTCCSLPALTGNLQNHDDVIVNTFGSTAFVRRLSQNGTHEDHFWCICDSVPHVQSVMELTLYLARCVVEARWRSGEWHGHPLTHADESSKLDVDLYPPATELIQLFICWPVREPVSVAVTTTRSTVLKSTAHHTPETHTHIYHMPHIITYHSGNTSVSSITAFARMALLAH